MKQTWLWIPALGFLLYACTENKKRSVNEKALDLNNRALDKFVKNQANEDSINYSLKLMDSAIALEPDHSKFYYNKVSILESTGQIDSALSISNLVINKFHDDPAAFYTRGILNRKNYSADSSRQDLETALHMLDRNRAIHSMDNDAMRIHIYQLLNDSASYIRAVTDFKRVYKDSAAARPVMQSFDSAVVK